MSIPKEIDYYEDKCYDGSRSEGREHANKYSFACSTNGTVDSIGMGVVDVKMNGDRSCICTCHNGYKADKGYRANVNKELFGREMARKVIE